MTSPRYAIVLLAAMAMPTGLAAAEPATNCAAIADPLAARICLINKEIARLEGGGAEDAVVCVIAGEADAEASAELIPEHPVCRGATGPEFAMHGLMPGDGSLRMSTSGPTTLALDAYGRAYPQVADQGLTGDQRRAALEARQSVLQTADARMAAGGVAAGSNNQAVWLIPLVLLLLLSAAGGSGSGEPISPS
jgi:hypothetical protein